MTQSSPFAPRRDRVGAAVSLALALMAHEAALAQTAAAPAAAASAPAAAASTPAAKAKTPVNELETVLVVGTRQSQRSAINRKKHADTHQDSIVAEDVGAFPDNNIGEAISRIAGVAIERGLYGEGTSVTIRGNGPESTRVEMDGLGVSSGAGTDLLGGGDGRGTEFRELPAELIKSVDIVKGATAAMTTGSLGASVLIETRTGLDFKKPFYLLKLSASQSDLAKKTKPNAHLTFADKFLGGNLGVLANLNYTRNFRENHSINQGGSNATQGLARYADFDNSPEKTFSFVNSARALDPSVADVPVGQWATTTGTWMSATPRQILDKSGAAQSKADCFTAFPTLSSADVASITTNANRTAAQGARLNEQLSCLNQWNDYTPVNANGLRYNLRRNDDKRNGGDLRLDWKVNDKLSVYGKWAKSSRHVEDLVAFIAPGASPTFNGTFTDNLTTNTRTLTPGASGSTLPGTYTWRANNAPLIQGTTTTILPGYTVDSSHHVTSYTTDGNSLGTDTIASKIDTTSKTLQFGGEYRDGRLQVKFMAARNDSTGQRQDRRAGFASYYGLAYAELGGNGLWSVSRPDGGALDQFSNMDGYAVLGAPTASTAVAANALNPVATPAYTAAQRAQYTSASVLQVARAFLNENRETNLKVDVNYDLTDKVPFLTKLSTGLQGIQNDAIRYSGNGPEIKAPVGTFGQAGFVPGVYLPAVNTRWNLVGCQDTAGSLAAGGQKCDYGVKQGTMINAYPGNGVAGTTTVTPDQLKQIVTQTMVVPPSGQYYGGSKDRPANLFNGFNTIDVYNLFDIAGFNVPDCYKGCIASDGNYYDAPKSSFQDKKVHAYLMTNFEVDRLPFTDRPLPFGMELAGNVGARVVRTTMSSTGFLVFRSIQKTANWVPGNGDTQNVQVAQVSQNVDFKGTRTDISPSVNLALWPVADKLVTRFSWSKNIGTLPLSRVSTTGDGGVAVTCTNSEIVDDLDAEEDGTPADQGCNRTFGNPALKPQTTINKNLSLEWYVNRETLVSIGVFQQRDVVGAPNFRAALGDVRVFANSNLVDPLTGESLANKEFNIGMWTNNPLTGKRRGLEFSGKTAFTFLPSVLRYTGMDANYTQLRNAGGTPMIDQISGETLPLINQPKYSFNTSLWYDDGALQFRIAQQVVAKRLFNFTPGANSNSIGVNNFPGVGIANWRLPYNPGAPVFSRRTAFIDAKVSYRFKNGLELAAEARNLTGERNQSYTGGYQNYTSGPSINDDGYYGRIYQVTATYRSPR
ncbi:TonB-dependent receptor [Roseateles sp. DC23W]|uniref:TonB-dependent receptor n=1 Tax=Pelomonas dachongensis TaxID=3299029 RepID=A0ABW7EP36_9BURK